MYDVIIIGAGISGSVSAKILADGGYRVLLVDRLTPPRNKVCSGVQLKYMEKIIGEKIPDDVLCNNKLRKIRVTIPSGKVLQGKMDLLNFWREDFDFWLNGLAINAGAETQWDCVVSSIKQQKESVVVKLGKDDFEARYVIGADGLSPTSFSRRWLKPELFSNKVTGSSLNYYFKGKSLVPSDTLHIFYRRDLSDLMYSWLYYKDDLLVVGTSSLEKLKHHADVFLKKVRKEFNLQGEKVRQDGYVTQSKGGIVLGKERVLLVGDAAGFLDLYRGVGMDSAALSGRICAKSLCKALETGVDGLKIYGRESSRLVNDTIKNMKKQEQRYASDKALDESFSTIYISKGILLIAWAKLWNKFCRPEELVLLPP
jgi:flavin-dependent dehydrogenase